MNKTDETPSQKIKRLERKLSDEKLKNKILNNMIYTSDQQYETSIRKEFLPKQIDNSKKKKD